ncbi:uncharacterized protein LOC104583459 [Brachypodium distachyon]|uniref:Uncharacterized protein n=1 Tax=Brachypodium distachyon TaxID=15368 RepID=I1HYI1_BRADI|nr:uncharacterized protein LOC104583459 [Brachypodium distachyon]KQJ93925.2 hypothetical protein BRADI_3g07510v3 [Brachypodium distachyon]|eukprot:XP_010234000.1 uncharacterized protein LOC104583459 [Brachypodium distachyon]
MAAALRCAVRRLGLGGRALQRPAVSQRVEDNPSGQIASLLAGRSRSISSAAAHSPNGNPKHPCASNQKQTEYLVSTHLKQIQKKKEELFNLIAELDSKLPSHCNRDNRELLMDLSAHVQPKPNDPQWRWYGGAKRCKNYVIYGGMLFLGYLSVSDEISALYAVLME